MMRVSVLRGCFGAIIEPFRATRDVGLGPVWPTMLLQRPFWSRAGGWTMSR